MKKILFLILFIISLSIIITLSITTRPKTFYLDENYYSSDTIKEISVSELDTLIENKKSFVVFVYQPMCLTSNDFAQVLNEFSNEEKIAIYKIAYSNIKDTKLGTKVKYYPSFLIYNKGKLISYLKSNKDEDTLCYTSKEEFKKWFTKYVKLKS